MKNFRIACFVTTLRGDEVMSPATGSAPSVEDMEAEALGKLRIAFPRSEGYSGHRVEITEVPEKALTRRYE